MVDNSVSEYTALYKSVEQIDRLLSTEVFAPGSRCVGLQSTAGPAEVPDNLEDGDNFPFVESGCS